MVLHINEWVTPIKKMLFLSGINSNCLHSLSHSLTQHNKNHIGGKLNLGYCCFRHAIHTGAHSQIHMCM